LVILYHKKVIKEEEPNIKILFNINFLVILYHKKVIKEEEPNIKILTHKLLAFILFYLVLTLW
jgi:hypothetical protein